MPAVMASTETHGHSLQQQQASSQEPKTSQKSKISQQLSSSQRLARSEQSRTLQLPRIPQQPADSQQPANSPKPIKRKDTRTTLRRRILRNAKPTLDTLLSWFFTSIFTIFLCLFGYHVLLQGVPNVGTVYLTASTTNLLLSIFSQIFTKLAIFNIGEVLDAFRWQLVAQKRGISVPAFFELSNSVGWISTLVFVTSKPLCWLSSMGIMRLAVPFLEIFFGSILKFQASFKYYFRTTGQGVPVFAGLMKIDTRVLSVVPTSQMCLFFIGWTSSFLGVSRFAVKYPMDNCGVNCTSVFLPGGMEVARKVAPVVRQTILHGGAFQRTESVRIENAPGYLLRFDQLGQNFTFNLEEDCSFYGQSVSESIQICIRDANGSVVAGWAVCPNSLYVKGECIRNTTWQSLPMSKTLLMTVYKQYARTVYDGADLSILDVQTTSGPQKETITADLYRPIWKKIFTPPGNESTVLDRVQVNSMLYSLGWLIRLYDDDFPDDPHTPLSYLQNFLAIPLQFNSVCIQYANYTVPIPGLFPMAPDTLTVAVPGMSADRFVSKAWTVWIFIVGCVVLMFCLGLLLLWVIIQKTSLPEFSGVPEWDFVVRCVTASDLGLRDESGTWSNVRKLVLDHLNLQKGSSRILAKELKQRRLKLIDSDLFVSELRTEDKEKPDTESGARSSLHVVETKPKV